MGNPIFTNEVAYKAFLLDEYVKDGGNRCPNLNCFSDQLEGGSYDHTGNVIIHEIACLNCGAEWDNIYTLTRAINFQFGSLG